MKRLYLLLLMVFAGLAAYACTASFSGTQAPSGNTLLNVNFTNSSSYGTSFAGQLKTGRIHYGDGGMSWYYGTSLPSHVYSSPGTYTVKLVVQSIDSTTFSTVCIDSTTISVTVAYPPCGTTISASGSGATRSFTAANPAATSGISYSWNFGDGTTGSGNNPSHTYTATGFYTVTCTSTVTAPITCSYINTVTIYVTVPAPPLSCSGLSANFTTSVSSGSTVVATNSSSTVSFPYSRRCTWHWGDGTVTYNGANTTSHTYTATGTYTIKLRTDWIDSLTGTNYCSDSITKSVTVSSLSPASISGYIIYDSTLGLQSFKVWLIQFNATTNILSAVDSLITPTSIWPGYTFSNVAVGNYLVKAAVHNGPTSGTGLVPTYHDSSITWNNAATVTATAGSSVYSGHIFMKTGTVTSGPGFVGGNVSLGANKGAAGGVAGLTIYLRKGTQVINMTTTNTSGNFNFTNVPAGSYTVYPELINYTTTPAAVTISNGSTTVNNVNFNQDDVKMSIAPKSLSVPGQAHNTASWTLAPNPASGKLNIFWKGLNEGAAGLVIMDIAGKATISQELKSTSGTQTIDIRSLRPGIYFVYGTGALHGMNEKLVVE